MRAFFDDEAQLGSDDEEKGDLVKAIDRNDAEEDEAGQDADLQDFVVHADEDEIGGVDEDMRAKFLADRHADDRAMTGAVMKSVFFGQNRKRKRGDVELGEGEDNLDSAFRKRLEERQLQRLSQEEDDQLVQLEAYGH